MKWSKIDGYIIYLFIIIIIINFKGRTLYEV